MKKFKKDNVILRTNDPRKAKELILRGFEEVKETRKNNTKKPETKASSD